MNPPSNKPYDIIQDHYTPECPICRGVMLPEKVERLTKALEAVMKDRDYWFEAYREQQQILTKRKENDYS